MNIFDDICQLDIQPTTIENVHESCYRSFNVIDILREMLDRKESRKSMIELIKYYKNLPQKEGRRIK